MAGEKMICKECDVEMNHHADKLVDPTSAAEAKLVDPALGGMVEEMHSCPACGCTDSRHAHPN
jgi:hypothetical protein